MICSLTPSEMGGVVGICRSGLMALTHLMSRQGDILRVGSGRGGRFCNDDKRDAFELDSRQSGRRGRLPAQEMKRGENRQSCSG